MPEDKTVSPVLLKQSTHTGVMRGRDVRASLDKRNLDPILVGIIADIAEINHTNMKAIAELATMFDQMLDHMQGVLEVASNMKDRTDQMARAMGEATEDVDENSVN